MFFPLHGILVITRTWLQLNEIFISNLQEGVQFKGFCNGNHGIFDGVLSLLFSWNPAFRDSIRLPFQNSGSHSEASWKSMWRIPRTRASRRMISAWSPWGSSWAPEMSGFTSCKIWTMEKFAVYSRVSSSHPSLHLRIWKTKAVEIPGLMDWDSISDWLISNLTF